MSLPAVRPSETRPARASAIRARPPVAFAGRPGVAFAGRPGVAFAVVGRPLRVRAFSALTSSVRAFSGPAFSDPGFSGPALSIPVLSILAISALAFSGVVPAGVAAQETISSDRPGIGSGSTVISPGILQFEGGVSRSHNTDVDSWSFGQLLVRYGVTGRVEAELVVNSLVVQRGPAGMPELDEEGIEDLAFGVKVRVAQGGAATFSLQGLATTRSGSSAFSAGEWYGTLYGLLDVTLSDAVGLSVNAGVRPAVGDLPAGYTVNVTPGASLGGDFGVYGGWAGAYTSDVDLNWLEGGATWLVSPDVQLDVNGAWSLEDAWFFGAGVAFRLGAE